MKKYQSGFSLLEALIGIALASMMGVVFSNMQSDSARNVREQNTAQYHKQVMTAAAAWIKDNYVTVQAAATATVPHKLTIATLIADNYLPSSFQTTNPYNQGVCTLTLEPTANKFETLVLSEGGANILPGRVPTIANLIGASGGYITPAGNIAQGSFGGWTRNITNYITQNCSGTASGADHVAGALFLDGDNLGNDYLYRNAVPGNPSANTMTTPLIVSYVKAIGDACTTTGAITTAADGSVLTCQGGTYQQQGSAYWKNPVANFASLPTCNAAAAWQTRVVQTPTVGTGPRAYTCNGTTSTWSPITTDDNGNLTVAGTGAITGDLTVGGNTTLGNASTDTVTIPGNANINKLSGNLEVTSTATEGTACSPNGRIARDSNGLILSCQSGVWGSDPSSKCPAGSVYTGGTCASLSSYYAKGAVVSANQNGTCPSGQTRIQTGPIIGFGQTYGICIKN